ncbi:hypothetical protein [uncultured Lutibacter sp.]|uniref:hypothetical protein n=1 Tax=uncultured Lutibacter sp. TaxID=437739 RepID=UPI002611CCC5|nr:hypothetical protein [uncultured Lutibacter sp.]
MKKKIISILILSFSLTTLFSQTNQKFIDTGSVKNQFDYLINKSFSYKEYKNIKLNWLTELEANVIDSLSKSKNEILKSYTIINSQKKTIDSLKTSIVNHESNITNLTNEKQSISLLGIEFEKSFFKTLMFSIIGILLILLFYYIFKYKSSNSITTQAKLDLTELEEEFETHRKSALEREQKAMRKLQDELNKQKKE